jgi:hypothetical protein
MRAHAPVGREHLIEKGICGIIFEHEAALFWLEGPIAQTAPCHGKAWYRARRRLILTVGGGI